MTDRAKPGHLFNGPLLHAGMNEARKKTLSRRTRTRYAMEKVKAPVLDWKEGAAVTVAADTAANQKPLGSSE